MQSCSFSKNERLLNRKYFVNLNQSGRKRHSAHFVVIDKQNKVGITRLGITVSKKTGNAVNRNRVKRLLREFFRLHKIHFPQGYDMVIAAKQGASGLDYREIKEELSGLILDKKPHS